jgi:hypothetical protein
MKIAVPSLGVTFTLFLSGLAACGSNKPAASSAKAGGELLSREEMVPFCMRLHEQGAKCPQQFVAVNVDLRVQYDPQFAEMMKDPAIRAQAEQEGAAETASDAANAKARCEEFVQPAWGPEAPRSHAKAAEGCYAKATCEEKMACLKPIIEPRFAYRAKNAAAQHGGGAH